VHNERVEEVERLRAAHSAAIELLKFEVGAGASARECRGLDSLHFALPKPEVGIEAEAEAEAEASGEGAADVQRERRVLGDGAAERDAHDAEDDTVFDDSQYGGPLVFEALDVDELLPVLPAGAHPLAVRPAPGAAVQPEHASNAAPNAARPPHPLLRRGAAAGPGAGAGNGLVPAGATGVSFDFAIANFAAIEARLSQ
jgi:hypothetical protein